MNNYNITIYIFTFCINVKYKKFNEYLLNMFRRLAVLFNQLKQSNQVKLKLNKSV